MRPIWSPMQLVCLPWRPNNKVMKANQSLKFFRRNLSSCPEGVKEAANKAIVRPHVENASSVWDPHLKKTCQTNRGSTLRRAAHFIKNCYTREPGTVTNLLNKQTKLDTPKGTKNNLAVNLIPQSNPW